ncbi:hypothetical protein [Lacihabitans soyangensis]|uniref:Collagen-like protein n=1 Tax=Lacihabitans soyangensis TaxID=869394 RepID=A0AAE3GYF7_9BACT|nr:hypothetical protein [Lacihabitans soyangensis]MCP9761337.1 hypothetical protein [Lacihabitans soyangensis]
MKRILVVCLIIIFSSCTINKNSSERPKKPNLFGGNGGKGGKGENGKDGEDGKDGQNGGLNINIK